MSLRLLTLGNQVHWIRESPEFAHAETLPGVHYGVGDDGLLRWYRFLGPHVDDPQNPGYPAWDHNSGNAIGNGWGGVRWMQLGSEGTLAVIKSDGGLYLYRYDGEGEDDPSASQGWLAGSGTKIGDGWDRFLHVAICGDVTHEEGLNDISLMAVDATGDMLWFPFGIQDGLYGPQPGSGRVIGNGWAECEHVVSTFGTVFAAMPSGELRWFAYEGGARNFVEWKTNSGNVIGTGWAGLRHIVAYQSGEDDPPDFTPTIELTTVDSSGNVRWHAYHGTGIADPTGGLGWAPDSGESIRSGW